MNAVEETAVIAEVLYDEHRLTIWLGQRTDLPMWHQLEGVERSDWIRRAARVQDRLALARRMRRKAS